MTTNVLDVFSHPIALNGQNFVHNSFFAHSECIRVKVKNSVKLFGYGENSWENYLDHFVNSWALFPPFTIVVVRSLICLYTFDAYIANNMYPYQTAVGSGFVVFASMIKSSLKCIWINAADVKN